MAFFCRQLYETTYRHFLKTKDEIKKMSPELLEEMGLDSDDGEEGPNMTEWPEYFEVNEVPKLMKTELKPKPKLKDFRSMESLLSEYDIRKQLDRKMEEFNQS